MAQFSPDSTKPGHFGQGALLLTVFITGAAVMVIELLGTRMIAPFYGTSLTVWSALISVTMIALAFGYFMGGRLADKSGAVGLALIIALAGLAVLGIPLLTRPVLLATDSLGLRLGAFVSALILFLPSLTFLGMVSPFAIKLGTARLEGIGRSAGQIYAVSTVGSVVGTLCLGFFLFPQVGSRTILISLGLILFALSLLVWFCERSLNKGAIALIANVFVLVAGLALLPKIVGAGAHFTGGNQFNLLSEQESLYGWVRVIEQPAKDLRFLTADASMIGAASISQGKSLLGYQQIVSLIPALAEKPMKRALIVGLGAGHMTKTLYDQFHIVSDTLEIDPAVAKAATDFFGFKPNGKSMVGDARYEIRHLQGPYDLIIHDCFTGGAEPAHLLTQESLTEIKRLLAPQGILALNFVGFSDDRNHALASVAKTLHKVFPQQKVFKADLGEAFNDFIFLASEQALNIQTPTLQPAQQAWLQQRLLPIDQLYGVLLTDDFNPLEHQQIAKAEQYRRVLVDWFGTELLLR